MANYKIKVCCVLLSLIMFMAAAYVSVGNAYARYENKVFCNTILTTQEKGRTASDCLTASSETKVIVLVGELSQSESKKTVTFNLFDEDSGKTEKFNWSLSTEHAQYLDIKMSIGAELLEQGEEVAVHKNGTKTITMTVQAKDAAWINAHEALDIDINIVWGDLSGTFRVNIPKVVIASEESGSSTESENTDVLSQTESTGTLMETAENQEAVSEAEESSDETEQEENGIMSLQTFNPEQLLPIKVMLKNDVSYVVFGLLEEGYTLARDFPEGTRFSLDNGESFYMLYSGGKAKIDAEDISGAVLFDFGKTELAEKESISILMEPWVDGVMQESSGVTISTNAEESFGTIENDNQGSILVSGNEQESSEAAMSKGWNPFVLNKENSVEFVFPAEWTEADLTYSVQILEIAENGSLVYNNSAGISSEYKKNENEHGLVLKIGDNVPKAGTYRVYMIWEYKGIRFYKNDITFFINYSTPSSGTLKS